MVSSELNQPFALQEGEALPVIIRQEESFSPAQGHACQYRNGLLVYRVVEEEGDLKGLLSLLKQGLKPQRGA